MISMVISTMLGIVITVLLFPLIYRLGQVIVKYMIYRAMIDDLDNDLDDEYYHHDEDYYRTHSDFVIIEIDDENNDDTNQSIT